MAYTDLPGEIQDHLKTLTGTIAGSNNETLEQFADVWLRKESMFLDQVRAVGMTPVGEVLSRKGQGLLALTSSGSLLSLSPGKNERTLEYASIKMRTDVPGVILEKISILPEKIVLKKPVSFTEGRISRTSPLYLLAVCPESVSMEEQAKRVREATIYLTNGFMKLNRSLHIDPSAVPDQYTMKNMIRYVAKMNGITGAEAKKIIEDFIYLIESGLCLGETVPLGRIGRFSTKRKDSQKARVLKHPATGKEITVDAKPAVLVPRITFSNYIRELLADLPVTEDTIERN